MVRDWRLLLPPAIVILLLIITFSVFSVKHSPAPKPVPPELTDSGNKANLPTQPTWYVRFSVKNQKSTYYTEATRAPASASAHGYFIGSGAVHPQYPLNAGGDARHPIIPFGTEIFLSNPIEVQGQKLTSLTVNDTGDVYYGLWHKYPYWVDVYSGTTNYYNNKSAFQAGVDLINYYWFEPWQ